MTASQFRMKVAKSLFTRWILSKPSVPYNAPASSFVRKYCSNMNKTCRPRTTRPLVALTSLKLRFASQGRVWLHAKAELGSLYPTLQIDEGLKALAGVFGCLPDLGTLPSTNQPLPRFIWLLWWCCIISSLDGCLPFPVFFSGLGNSGNFNESAALTFGGFHPFGFHLTLEAMRLWANPNLSTY